MHKAMTSPAQPRHIFQLILSMPSPFQDFLMHTPWYQMMESKWDPGALADLTLCDERTLFARVWRGREQGTKVCCQDGGEELVGGLIRSEERVCHKRVCACWRKRVEDVCNSCGRKRISVEGLQRRGIEPGRIRQFP